MNRLLLSGLPLLLAAFLTAFAGPAGAQNPFRPMARVNEQVITAYEFEQRKLLLQALRVVGDLDKLAMDALIDDRLKMAAAKRAGIEVTPEDVSAGLDEMAGRSGISGEELKASLAAQGVEPQTLEGFVRVGLAWRQLVRSRFSNVAISEAEIDRAMALAGTRGSARVQISEIFLPTMTPELKQQSEALAPQIAAIRSIKDFADAARRFSAGPSRVRGGRIDKWLALEDLPPQLQGIVLTMKPGEVTRPIEIPNALALFQLRAIEPTPAKRGKNPGVDYAEYRIAGGNSPAARDEAARVAALADTCDDLYGILRDRPAELLQRHDVPLGQVPADVAVALASLDPGEVSTALTTPDGQYLRFLMLCSRTPDRTAVPTRDEVRTQLFNRRLNDLAAAYLAQLRSEAVIVRP